MTRRRYTLLILVGIAAIIFDVLMLGGSVPLALALGFGVITAVVLIELGIAGLEDD